MKMRSQLLTLALLATCQSQDIDSTRLNSTLLDSFQSVFGPPPGEGGGGSEVKRGTEDPLSILSPPPTNGTEGEPERKCTRPADGKAGVCVIYYQCRGDTKEVITDGETLIDFRIGKYGCPKYYEVCCILPEVNLMAPKPSDLPAILASSPKPATTSSTSTTATPDPDPPSQDGPRDACGYSNLGDTFRAGGEALESEFLEFPWVVALLKRSAPAGAWSRNDYIGGGTLIHPAVILTAAHKVDKIPANNLKVRAGEFDTTHTQEVYRHQERDVKKVVKHENFFRPAVLNNIALVFLEAPFKLSNAPNIGIGCLAPSLPPHGTRCWGVGWGRTSFQDEESYANVLKKISVPVVGRKQCEIALQGTRLGSYFRLHESLMCAGGDAGLDTCVGDGGSPLICSIGELKDLRYAVYGAVSYGIGCGTAGVPAVYTNLPLFNTWVEDQMKAEGYTSKSYTI